MIPYDIDQTEWGARGTLYPDGHLTPWRPDKVVIHYGGNANFAGDEVRAADRGYPYPSIEAETAVLRIYEQSHLSRGWSGIAYNYAVGQSGTRYRLRGENRSGATSGDFDGDGIPENHEARAILWIGGKDQTPTQAALDAISSIINAGPLWVTAHSDHKSTGCPGDPLRAWIIEKGWEPVGYYPDVPDDHPFAGDIEAIRVLGITRVPEGSEYRPDDAVTRGEMAAFLNRTYKKAVDDARQ